MSEVITATEVDGILYVEATELQKKQKELSNLKAELSAESPANSANRSYVACWSKLPTRTRCNRKQKT